MNMAICETCGRRFPAGIMVPSLSCGSVTIYKCPECSDRGWNMLDPDRIAKSAPAGASVNAGRV